MKRYLTLARLDPVWSKVISFSIFIFFVRMADALISFWAPNVIQSSLNSSVLMGLVISFQSVVGFVADLVFPHMLKNITIKRLIIYCIGTSAITTLALFISGLKPFLVILLIAMFAWGIYYELENFAIYQFIDRVAPRQTRSAVWGIMDAFKNLAYFLGPLAGAYLILQGNYLLSGIVFGLLLIAFILFSTKSKLEDRHFEMVPGRLDPLEEIKYWITLFEHVWPIILMTLFMGFIDSTFWTTGAVLTEKLAHQNILGGFFLPLYQLPSLFVGFAIARMGISEGKKKLSETFLFIAGVFLTSLIFIHSIYLILLIVLASSLSLAVSYPLLEGVYSDIIGRLGKERKHMIAFTSAVVNVAYVIWPPITGAIAAARGEVASFVTIGGLTVVISIFLLLATPRKLHLPQLEIAEWKE